MIATPYERFLLLAGVLLAAVWLFRVLDAFFGMRRMPDISAPAWDREPHAADGHTPRVTVIVPARNEERDVEAALRSLLELDYPAYDIIAVNDRSSDLTGPIMRRLARVYPERLRVLQIDELLPGWLGKTHAMWLAAEQATGEWLLFTDADVVFRADSLKRAVAYANEAGVDHVVLSPELEMHTAGERMMLAVFQIMFAFWHRPWRVQDAARPEHIGVGAFNLIRREVYESVGTYRALRLAIVDDMKLGQLVKQSGFRQRFVVGRGLISLRWISGALAMVNNLTKNFFAVLDYSVSKALAFTFVLLLLHLGPFAGVLLAPGWTKVGYGIALAAISCLYIGLSWHSPVPPVYFCLHPVGTLLFAYTILRSMILTLWQGGVIWRGTKYSLRELRKEGLDRR